MASNDFFTGEEMGIKANDHLFLSRFERNLALERRFGGRAPTRRLGAWLEGLAGAAAVMMVIQALAPSWFAAFSMAMEVKGILLAEAAAAGFSPTQLVVLAGGILGTVLVAMPRESGVI